jgi:hypothetical protein
MWPWRGASARKTRSNKESQRCNNGEEAQ